MDYTYVYSMYYYHIYYMDFTYVCSMNYTYCGEKTSCQDVNDK